MANFYGKFVWYELMTTDTKAAETLYRSVVGWGAKDAGLPNHAYTLFHIKVSLLREALTTLSDLPDISLADLPDLLDALLAGTVVRRPRTKDGHPRVAIWGVQEALLQSVDVAVLGGLVEGVWPAMAEPGPWLSRPMRKAAGLPAPEAAIAAAAHDFFSLAAACGTVVLAAPARRERAPAVPARWLTRLNALLEGAGMALPAHEAASWAAQLDAPSSRIARPRPEPRPPAAARPTSLSISDVTMLLADPYAIYARRIWAFANCRRSTRKATTANSATSSMTA